MAVGTQGFIGRRLTEAREARGLSITSLIESLEGKVTVAAVSQYEKSMSTPRPEVAELLAEKLQIPFAFFFSKSKHNDDSLLYWRSLSSATKTARTRVRRRFVWFKEISEYLKTFLEFPEVNFPTPEELGVPHDPTILNHNQLDEIAQRCRQYWELDNAPIDNLVDLLERQGAVLSRGSIFSDKLDAFSQFSSIDETPYIFLATDKNSAVRSRLDAAHELAHLVLHRHVSEESFKDKEIHSKLEKDAFYFGSAFLLPKQSFSEDFRYPTLNSLLYLKRKWNVSIGAMIIRSKELGLIEKSQADNLWINYSRRGWKKQEPLDDSIRPEIPRVLRKGFEVLIEKNIKTTGQILNDLPFESSDIEELTGLPKGYLLKAHFNIGIKPKQNFSFDD